MTRKRKKKIRLRTLSVFAVACIMGALLLRVSQNVQVAEQKLAELTTTIDQEKNSIRLLNAEWAYLNNPERLEKLSAQYLELMPPQPSVIATVPDQIPARTSEILSAMNNEPQHISLKGNAR